ncbi:MAG TPA: hypothetical protein VM890_08120 [Longimicrobium sp.]|jgi:hypothetical protein|nr:hypothetical protein [Longimicrobium sp.]
MRYPGEVWFLPPEARAEGDFKWRRHVLLTTCRERGDIGIFAYASTSAVEPGFGGANVLVDPYASTYRHTGFSAFTYVMPCRLVPATSEDMQRMAGRLIDEMPAIRSELRRALGIGTGTCAASRTSASLRGCVVELRDGLATESGVRLGVIVTEAGYSLAGRYQLLIPLLDAAEYDSQADDVLAIGTKWARELFPPLEQAILAVRLVQTAFQPLEIARVLPIVVDDATIGEIDRALLRVFGL